MNDNYFKNISNRTSPSNFQINNATQQYTRIVVKNIPRQKSLKILHKKSAKNILPKYLLHVNFEVEKEKLLHEIQQQNLKLRQQFSLKKSLEKKLKQKLNPQQPKLQLKKGRKTLTRNKSALTKTVTSSSSQMQLIAHRSVQNEIKSINNQIQSLMAQKEKNNKKILEIKQSKRYTRFIENQQQKQACLSQLNELKKNLKNLKLQIKNTKRAHMQRKKLRIQQLLMQGEIQNSIERQNIQLYYQIEEIKQEIRNVSSKKASMFIQKQKLLQQIQKMKEIYDIPVEVIEAFNRSVDASKKWASYSSLSNSKLSYKKKLNKNEMSCLKEQGQQQEQDSIQYNCQKNYTQNERANNISQKKQDQQSNKTDIDEQIKRRQQQRKTIQQLQKKYFSNNNDQNYEQDYEQEDNQQQTHNQNNSEKLQYGKQDDFQSQEQDQFEKYEELYKKEINVMDHCGTAKVNRQEINNDQVENKFINRVKRGVSF